MERYRKAAVDMAFSSFILGNLYFTIIAEHSIAPLNATGNALV